MNFFDVLIILLITITALPAVILLYSRKKRKDSWENKNKKQSLILAVILLLGTTIITYGSFIEPQLIITNYQKIDLEKINSPIRIAVIADFQVGYFKQEKYVEKVTNRILELNPDLVFIVGDIVDNAVYEENEAKHLIPIKRLTDTIPTYAIHGNHEYGIGGGKSILEPAYRTGDVTAETKEIVESFGIRYLVNEIEEIKIKEEKFYLFGGDSIWAGKLDYSILKNRNENLATIALIHNPLVVFQAYKHNIDLMLSGHTHGGQVRLPFIGPLGRVDNMLPAEWYQGWNEFEGLNFFVTSGIGESGTRARLFNPPEIVMLTVY
ncbi:MAG: metallophosphoesterase [Candidatus Magasanikbacteria bacterium]